ncbi:trehalose-6-phosphate synthase [Acidiferrimicrobium sp. IK]|uniref:alpha,alpha-trehalose-phosphate synthase (UDP-forming) n=1 Tax=Acidiferrimicrobium sp. IK TaxID=2871700 RepID=UPI0021CB1429|nr:trehalose-6-phosphate synthase [Acidiferrimicrobium sp. IK]MCU4186900.1 trehalose-6-phosphate synthase [Acidiferrimicrobium sp. IK]
MPSPVVVSNRGPLAFSRGADGSLVPRRGAGGLVVTLGPGAQRAGALWVSAALGDADREAAAGAGAPDGIVHADDGFRWKPVVVDPVQYQAYYDVVANGALWYCTHGLWDLPRRPRFDRHWRDAWASYRAVNSAFADAVAATAEAGSTVLLQDYHLGLVGAMLRDRRPDLRTSLFVHTPWCSPGEMAVLPDDSVAELLAGMTGAGAVGFHSPRWADAFAECCRTVLGASPATFVAPAATDADDLRAVAASQECRSELAALDRLVGDRQLIVRVDRIELSKNILRGFWAFDELLETRADLRGRVVFGAFVYPSRQGLPDYLAYGQEVRTVVELLNAKWGDDEWTPIVLDPTDNYHRSVAALRRYDVLLVNPIRDGLNLVAQEGPLVNDRSGTVVLSRQAGVWDSLGEHSLGINPFDVTATAEAIAEALDRRPDARTAAAERLATAVGAHSPLGWWDALVDAAALTTASDARL